MKVRKLQPNITNFATRHDPGDCIMYCADLNVGNAADVNVIVSVIATQNVEYETQLVNEVI